MIKHKKTPGVFSIKLRSNLPRGVSREETELSNTIQLEFPSKHIERSNRQVLHGKELDIYIPENRLAVEYDGVYFHSTAKKDDEFYHLWKTIECEKKGIRLIHILSDEWELKRPLVIDNLKKALGKFRPISAQSCRVVELSPKEEQVFSDANHLLGYLENSAYCIGLETDRSIVMAISLVKVDDIWIIKRIIEKRGYFVIDGLAKLLAFLIRNKVERNDEIYASIDRRFEDPYELVANGFVEIAPTNPQATYTKDFQHRFYEKDFKKFNESVLLLNGWQKIYDCGRRRFKLKLS